MGESAATNNHHQHDQVFNISVDVPPHLSSKCIDDDGRPQRTGTVWTASAHIITAVIGSGVLSLAWAIAQLGWIAGPTVMFLFAFVIYYTSTLLADCYRSGDPLFGKRNYTYMDAVRSNLGGSKVKLCGLIQYMNIFGVAIGYTIAASISMMAIKRSNCFHESGRKNPCHMSSLGVAKVAANGTIGGSFTGISIGTVTQTQKIWRSFQALGNIAFAYSFSIILIEIQDTVKSPPSEAKTMKKATLISTSVTTLFYMLCGCMGYAAFGDLSPVAAAAGSIAGVVLDLKKEVHKRRNYYEGWREVVRRVFMNGGSIRRILGFSRTGIAGSKSDIWLFGACYGVAQDEDDANYSCSDSTQNDGYAAFVDDFSSRILITYRKGFLPIGDLKAFLIHKLGRSWRKSLHKICSHRHIDAILIMQPLDQSYIEILLLFGDSEDSPYSIHNLLQAGKAYGLASGSWVGPYAMCRTWESLIRSKRDGTN
ncbi:unnamed protein product [Fraxinus pennsylvanica]|uniref:Cysteine protease n=1 Tax=Fraxinus pennsylvanica TaxID=56036 RepID=A0AAD1YQE2_9LAMI|nr:unnamed protein product [Fraxinus pennsylvanica]